MFRLNLYPEAETKRRAQVRRTGATAVVTLLVAATVILTLFHAGSGFVIADRTRGLVTLRAKADADAAAARPAGSAKELAQIRARLDKRAGRILWSPKFAEIARALPNPLVIENIMIAERGRGQSIPAFTIHGSVISGAVRDPVPTIVSYVNALKANPIFFEGLESVELASVSTDETTGLTTFQIVCPIDEGPPAGEAAAGGAAEGS